MLTQGHDLHAKQREWVRNWRLGQPLAPFATTPFAEALLALQTCNVALWDLEDQARNPRASDSDLGELKRQIDNQNLKRVKAINALDTCLVQDFLPADFARPEAASEMNTETPGQILDRLSILAMKIYHGEAISTDSGREAVSQMKAQTDFLCHRLTQLLEALNNHHLLYFPSVQFKIYQGQHHL